MRRNERDLLLNELIRSSKKKIPKEKSFKCNFCSSTFSTNFYLMRHVDRVHPKYRFVCDHCKAEFSDKSSISEHIQLQHTKRDFRKMRKSKEQTSHAVPLPLSIKTECILDEDQVQQPIITQWRSPEEFFTCKLCSYGTNRKQNLTTHMKKLHPNVFFGSKQETNLDPLSS